MKLLGRKGLALESELHAIETETETVSETVIDDTNVRREDTETTEGDDGFIDSALLDAGGASGDSRDDGDAASGGDTVSGKDGKKSRSDPPPAALRAAVRGLHRAHRDGRPAARHRDGVPQGVRVRSAWTCGTCARTPSSSAAGGRRRSASFASSTRL